MPAHWSKPSRGSRAWDLHLFLLERLPAPLAVEQGADGLISRVYVERATQVELFAALREAQETGGFADVIPPGFVPGHLAD